MPLVGLGVPILWLGWFGFNPGSTLGAIGGRFAEVVVVTTLPPPPASSPQSRSMCLKTKTIDIGMAGNGALAGLVAITAPSGYVEYWAALFIGAIAGVLVVYGVLAFETPPSTIRSARSRPTASPVSGGRCHAGSLPRHGWRN